MPTTLDNHEAHDYAERIRDRLPRRLQEIREAAGFTKYGLARESGVISAARTSLCRASSIPSRRCLTA
jgi:hypothetical protein